MLFSDTETVGIDLGGAQTMQHILTFLGYVLQEKYLVNPIVYRTLWVGVLIVTLVNVQVQTDSPGPPIWP